MQATKLEDHLSQTEPMEEWDVEMEDELTRDIEVTKEGEAI